MQTEIKVIRVVDEFIDNGKGGYNKLSVTYDSMYQGKSKTDTKKIMSFASPEAYNALKSAAPDSKWMITSEKEGEYRVWKNAVPSNGQAAPSTGTTSTTASKGTPVASRGDWETSEERARKQVYIVKQSSISAAIALLKTDKKQPEVAEVLKVAQEFTDFVFGTAPAAAKSDIQGVLDLNDDIPL